mgnify:CR=1 FL=1
MVQIPQTTKEYLKNAAGQFNYDPESIKEINSSILVLATKAVGNAIKGDEPYTIRINFQNGRIVGSQAQPRLSVELLDGRAATSAIGVPDTSSGPFVEFKYLWAEGKPAITNDGSWVARAKIDGLTVTSVCVNHDFDEEDREIIKTALLRNLMPQVRM